MNSEQVVRELERGLPHREAMLRVAQRYVDSIEDAEDVLQAVHLELWSLFASREYEVEDLRGFIFTVVKRTAIKQMLQSKHERELRADMRYEHTYADEHGTATSGARIELMVMLNDLIDKLPPRQRQALLLTVREGYTQEETAEIMGVTQQAVQQLLARAEIALVSA